MPLTILTPEDGESWSKLLERLRGIQGDLLLVLAVSETDYRREEAEIAQFLEGCAPLSGRLRVATRSRRFAIAARRKGFRVIDRTGDLKQLLEGHPSADEAFLAFHPQVWRQQLRSRLQAMGLLSLPKLRVWVLIGVSALLFFMVLFRLLPSATIRIHPREDTVTQTVNIFLVLSGSQVEIPSRVRTMELLPLVSEITHTVTFDQISKEFMGTSARVAMTIVNKSSEQYSLRRDSRLANQAGMVFRLEEEVIIDSGSELTVSATADDLDLYGEVIGERGNVPANLKWDFVGLSSEERRLVYGVNRVEATGGETAFRTVLLKEDLAVAQEMLKEELLALAKREVDEQRELWNSRHDGSTLDMLYYEELTKAAFSGMTLPFDFVGEEVATVPVTATITYIAYAYDKELVLRQLTEELRQHVGHGKRLVEDSVSMDRLVPHVIDYSDDLSWIKLTVDLSGTEQYVLDPLTPVGARFAKKAREAVQGLSIPEAVRVLKNFPEVREIEIATWPPWNRTLPTIPVHIYVESF